MEPEIFYCIYYHETTPNTTHPKPILVTPCGSLNTAVTELKASTWAKLREHTSWRPRYISEGFGQVEMINLSGERQGLWAISKCRWVGTGFVKDKDWLEAKKQIEQEEAEREGKRK